MPAGVRGQRALPFVEVPQAAGAGRVGGGLWAELDPALLVGRNVGVQGFYLGRLMSHRPEVVQEAIGEVMRLWEEGAVRPIVGAVYRLADAAEAHRLIEERRHRGKVVLVP